MKKINLLLSIALIIQTTLVKSKYPPPEEKAIVSGGEYMQDIVDIFNTYNLKKIMDRTQVTEQKLETLFYFFNNPDIKKHTPRNIAYSLQYGLYHNYCIIPTVKATLQKGSYKKLFKFLQSEPYFIMHLEDLQQNFIWTRYKYIPYILCTALMTYTIFFVKSIHNTIRTILTALVLPPLAYKTYASYKDASIIKNITYILNQLNNSKLNCQDTRLLHLKNEYCPEQ